MRLPSIDLHAHVDVRIAPEELRALNSVVFAATRSLDEAEEALRRSDPMTIWGVGCHPGLVRAQRSFDEARFRSLVTRTPYVSELGLDGDSRVPMDQQIQTLDAALEVLSETPRITALHSYRATAEVLEVVERHPQPGVLLHWWLGDEEQTARAVDLGCYFSVNSSSVKQDELLARLPIDRVFPETDHPFGDRRGQPRRPGAIAPVESALAQLHGITQSEVRELVWRSFSTMASQPGVRELLPRDVRRLLLTL